MSMTLEKILIWARLVISFFLSDCDLVTFEAHGRVSDDMRFKKYFNTRNKNSCIDEQQSAFPFFVFCFRRGRISKGWLSLDITCS